MLGVAAEQVFGRLAAAFVTARPAETRRLQGFFSDNTTHYRRFDEFRKRLEPLRGALPDGLADSITLDAVADLLRVTRNAAGHPTGQRVDEETAYTHLVMAGMLLAKMTELAQHFESSA
jgi:NADPH:quinone reductase-like Zn-dependent oxidoreductase